MSGARRRCCTGRSSRRREAWVAGERDAGRLRAIVLDVLASEPLADVEYVSCADARTLAELDRVEGPALLSLAVRFGRTRLIDNEWLGDGTEDGLLAPTVRRPDHLGHRRGAAGEPVEPAPHERRRAGERGCGHGRRMPVETLQEALDVEVVGDEALDLVDLRRVGGVGLDQQIVDRCSRRCTSPATRGRRTGPTGGSPRARARSDGSRPRTPCPASDVTADPPMIARTATGREGARAGPAPGRGRAASGWRRASRG